MKIHKNDILDLSPEQYEEAARLLQRAMSADPSEPDATNDETGNLTVPYGTINRLPSLLRDGAGFLQSEDEKSVFLTTAFPVIAGCLPNVRVPSYDGNVSPNLYAAVFAEAGAGKGAMRFARLLGTDLDRQLRKSSLARLTEWKKQRKNGETDESAPVTESLFISLNSSSRGMIDALSANDGKGVLCDTELLTAVIAQKNEWGNSRDLLLKAYQNEPIDLDRKAGERIWIPEPQLSVAVTGTPSAFAKFFPTVEDGLFSRFNFYTFSPPVQWRSQKPPPNAKEREDHFERSAKELTDVHRTLRSRTTPLVVTLSEDDWIEHDSFFSHLLGTEHHPLNSSVKRAGLTALRVTAILTMLRLAEGEHDLTALPEVVATPEDVQTGRELASVWLHHAFRLAGSLADLDTDRRVQNMTENQARFRSALGEVGMFSRSEAHDIASEIGLSVSPRTIDDWIGGKIPGIIRQDHGVYRVAVKMTPPLANPANPANRKKPEDESEEIADIATLALLTTRGPPFRDTS